MPIDPNRLRFRKYPQKRQVGVECETNPSDVAILNMPIDTQSFFCRSAPRLLAREDDGAVDDVFQALLTDANSELASLLQDIRTGSHSTIPGDTRNQQFGKLLMRAVRCAAKQYMLQAELGNLAFTDELTGLYNRRGFMALAERQLKLGQRSGREMMLFVLDVDRLKQINDSFGHSEGDRALRYAAEALEKTFRGSDVIARLGGDEFAVLAIEASDFSEGLIEGRLSECLRFDSQKPCYSISLCMGAARFDPRSGVSLEELMVQADHAMYKAKRARSRPSANREVSYLTQ